MSTHMSHHCMTKHHVEMQRLHLGSWRPFLKHRNYPECWMSEISLGPHRGVSQIPRGWSGVNWQVCLPIFFLDGLQRWEVLDLSLARSRHIWELGLSLIVPANFNRKPMFKMLIRETTSFSSSLLGNAKGLDSGALSLGQDKINEIYYVGHEI